ncbi:hypothetical protein HDV05_005603 [Chytridiales sp. JEL 0842]|nr:hypothetical protein HDV05_005603 [Chytridiales sp. JEL 0842]
MQRPSTPSYTLPSPKKPAPPSIVTYTVPIDPSILEDLEREALKISKNLDSMLTKLQSRMSDMTTYTLQSLQAHQLVIESLCDQISTSREQTVKLITAMDLLTKDMEGVHDLAAQM